MQSDWSVKNGRGCRLNSKRGFLTKSKKGFFDSTFFDFVFRPEDPVEKFHFFGWIYQSKNSVEKVSHLLFQLIASLIPPQHTDDHTSIPGTIQQYHTTASTLPWKSLLLRPQVSVAHS